MDSSLQVVDNPPDEVEALNPYRAKINKELALVLFSKGKTYTEIAEVFNCTISAVSQLLKSCKEVKEQIEAYKNEPALMWRITQLKLGATLNKTKLKKNSAHTTVVDMGICEDKIAQLTGKSVGSGLTIAPFISIIVNGEKTEVKQAVPIQAQVVDNKDLFEF